MTLIIVDFIQNSRIFRWFWDSHQRGLDVKFQFLITWNSHQFIYSLFETFIIVNLMWNSRSFWWLWISHQHIYFDSLIIVDLKWDCRNIWWFWNSHQNCSHFGSLIIVHFIHNSRKFWNSHQIIHFTHIFWSPLCLLPHFLCAKFLKKIM